jgi:hypothetical protein
VTYILQTLNLALRNVRRRMRPKEIPQVLGNKNKNKNSKL